MLPCHNCTSPRPTSAPFYQENLACQSSLSMHFHKEKANVSMQAKDNRKLIGRVNLQHAVTLAKFAN